MLQFDSEEILPHDDHVDRNPAAGLVFKVSDTHSSKWRGDKNDNRRNVIQAFIFGEHSSGQGSQGSTIQLTSTGSSKPLSVDPAAAEASLAEGVQANALSPGTSSTMTEDILHALGR